MTTTNNEGLLTLHQHSDQINDQLGRNVAYATTVIARYDVAAAIRAVDTARRPLVNVLGQRLSRDPEAAYSGERLVTLPNGAAVLYRRRKEGQRTTRVAPADRVRKAYPDRYEAAKTLVTYRRVAAPKGHRSRIVGTRFHLPKPLHEAAVMALSVEQLAGLVNLPVFTDTLPALRHQLEQLDTQLETIAAETGWDGQRRKYADGWAVELRRWQYSSDRLAEIDPAVFDAMAEERQYRSGGGWYRTTDHQRELHHAMTTGHIDTGAVDLDAD